MDSLVLWSWHHWAQFLQSSTYTIRLSPHVKMKMKGRQIFNDEYILRVWDIKCTIISKEIYWINLYYKTFLSIMHWSFSIGENLLWYFNMWIFVIWIFEGISSLQTHAVTQGIQPITFRFRTSHNYVFIFICNHP